MLSLELDDWQALSVSHCRGPFGIHHMSPAWYSIRKSWTGVQQSARRNICPFAQNFTPMIPIHLWFGSIIITGAISLRSTRAYRPKKSTTRTATLLVISEFGQFCRHYYFFWWCNYRVQPLPSRFAKSWEHVRFMTLMYSLNLNQSSLQKKQGLIKLVRMRMRRVSRGEVRGGRLGCAKNLWIAA